MTARGPAARLASPFAQPHHTLRMPTNAVLRALMPEVDREALQARREPRRSQLRQRRVARHVVSSVHAEGIALLPSDATRSICPTICHMVFFKDVQALVVAASRQPQRPARRCRHGETRTARARPQERAGRE